MRILITGAKGFIGQYFLKELENFDTIKLSHSDLNLEDKTTIERILSLKPDMVIHPAAIRSPDVCEENPHKAFQVNALGAKHIAITCGLLDIPMVYISTDYVFSGEKNDPYTEFDTPKPLNVYGRTKLWGEIFTKEFCKRHFIIRTSYVFGEYGDNTLNQIYGALKEGKELRLSNFHFASATYAGDLARKVRELIGTKLYGVYHVVNKGIVTRYDFACKVAETSGFSKDKIIPLTPENFNNPAPRPLYSVLENYVLKLYGMDDLSSYEERLKKCTELLKSHI